MKLPKNISWYGIGVIIALVIIVQYKLTHPSKTSAKENYVMQINSDQEFKTILDNAGSKMLVVDLYADWCAPCRIIEPTMAKLADKYQGKVDFYKVNIDKNPKTAAVFRTQAIPYVVFIKDQKVFASFSGVKPPETYEKIISVCVTSTEPCDKVIQNM